MSGLRTQAGGPAAIQLSKLRRLGQGHDGVGPAPPAARVQPKADTIRPLLVKPGQTRFETFDGLGGQAKPPG
jgi:hypothetical protein